MSEFEQKPKPKRKHEGRNPYLFLVAGIVIGIFVASLVAVGLLFLGFSSSSVMVAEPVVIVSTVDNQQPTLPPFNAQGVQATPIANRIQSAAISSDGNYLAYVSVEAGVSHIYLNELSVSGNLTGNQYLLGEAYGYFNDIVFSPDSTKLIATVDSGAALFYDVRSRTLIEEYATIGGAAFTRDSDFLVLVGRSNGIRVLDITDIPTLAADRNHNVSSYTVGAVAISGDNKLAIALDNRIEIYSLDNLLNAPQVIEPNNGVVSDLAFHPTLNNKLAVGLGGFNIEDGMVQIYDLSNNSRSQYDFGTRVTSLAFSPDGEWLAIGGGETGYAQNRLIAFRWDSSNNPIPADPTYYQPIDFEGHEHTILDVAFTNEGYLLSTGWDGSVRLWDLFSPDNALSVYYP